MNDAFFNGDGGELRRYAESIVRGDIDLPEGAIIHRRLADGTWVVEGSPEATANFMSSYTRRGRASIDGTPGEIERFRAGVEEWQQQLRAKCLKG